MAQRINRYPLAFKLMAVLAVLFGIMTIRSGGMVLFTSGAAHQAAGNYVPFVLWFNFVAGFVYLVAGIGLWLQQRWSGWLALMIATSTLVVFAALTLYILQGGAYEVRTIGAMTLRSAVWAAISGGVFGIAGRETLKNGKGKIY